MWRVVVSEVGQSELPPIDVDGDFTIGSGEAARVRLPAALARPDHVKIEGGRWRMGVEAGDIGDGVTLEIGAYRVRLARAPAGAIATPPQRTESLARELVRSLLGASGAPTLELERTGAKRALAPPESVLVIGRGDEAGWIIDHGDLSRAHAEVRRGWDGVRVVDLDSKNGTKVDGRRADGAGAPLHDGSTIELGKVVFRFRDPAEKRMAGELRTPEDLPRASTIPFYAAIAIIIAALAGLVWVVST